VPIVYVPQNRESSRPELDERLLGNLRKREAGFRKAEGDDVADPISIAHLEAEKLPVIRMDCYMIVTRLQVPCDHEEAFLGVREHVPKLLVLKRKVLEEDVQRASVTDESPLARRQGDAERVHEYGFLRPNRKERCCANLEEVDHLSRREIPVDCDDWAWLSLNRRSRQLLVTYGYERSVFVLVYDRGNRVDVCKAS
jgi:hypothetical protein